MPAPVRPEVWPSLQVSGGVFYFYTALVCFAAVLLLIHRIIRSPFGYALIGIRENEDRMRYMGFNVWRHKFLVFLISGGLSGFAGVLWAYYNGFVSPYNASFELSAEALLIVILGGSGTLIGPAMGTAVVVLIRNIVAAYTERWLLVLGLAYILTILYARRGILGTIGTWLRRAGTSR
jgi:branched-chain amino acid transport system permease protein